MSEVGNALFSDHDVWLPLQDIVAHQSDFLHLLFESVSHCGLSLEFHVGLTLSFLVL